MNAPKETGDQKYSSNSTTPFLTFHNIPDDAEALFSMTATQADNDEQYILNWHKNPFALYFTVKSCSKKIVKGQAIFNS